MPRLAWVMRPVLSTRPIATFAVSIICRSMAPRSAISSSARFRSVMSLQDHEGVVFTVLLIRGNVDLHVERGPIGTQAARLVGRRYCLAPCATKDILLDLVAAFWRNEVQDRFAGKVGPRGKPE